MTSKPSEGPSPKTFKTHTTLLILLGLLGLTYFLHGNALTNWWCCDDPQILKHASQFSPIEYFFVPDAWRSLIPYSLTPWLTFAYDLDLALFGFEPRWFYAHNLLVIGLCAWLLYLIAGEWLSTFPALGSAVMFLMGAPVTLASQQLMVRQYIEGMFFFLLSIWLVIQGTRRNQFRWGLWASTTFVVAISAKEVYLPLGFLAFLLPLGTIYRRLAIAWPLLLVIGLYIPWRSYMLGDTLGGYTPIAELRLLHRLEAFANELIHAPKLLWIPSNYAFIAIGLTTVAIFPYFSKKTLVASGWLFALPILLLTPLVPLAIYPGLGAGSERYYIAIWAACALVYGVMLDLASKNRGAWAQILALALFGLMTYPAWKASLMLRDNMHSLHAVYGALGQAIATHTDNTIIVTDAHTASWYNLGLQDLRSTMGILSAPPLLATDMSELTTLRIEHQRVLRFVPEQKKMEDITLELPAIMNQWRKKLRADHFSVELRFDPVVQVLHWQFSTNEPGSYIFIDQGGQLAVPQQGVLRMTNPPQGCFRIRFDSPKGWSIYSPKLAMTPSSTSAPTLLSWQGTGDMFDQLTTADCVRANAR